MAVFIYDRRKVIGSEQLKEGEQILTTKEYALTFNYSHNHVAKLCRRKKVKAYKSAGQWYIVTSETN